MPDLFIDIDTCPVYREVCVAAHRHSLNLYVVTRDYVELGPNVCLIATEADDESARAWIAGNIDRGDICVTADAALATRCVRRGARALRPTGRNWTEPDAAAGVQSPRLDIHAVTGMFAEPGTQSFTARLDAAIAVARATRRSDAPVSGVVPGAGTSALSKANFRSPSSEKEGVMWSTRSVVRTLVAASLVGGCLAGTALAAENCTAAVASAKDLWRALSHGMSHVAPSQTIVTSDGRRLSGSSLNYGWVLISRAEDACQASNVSQSLELVRQVETLFHPAPRSL